MTAIDTLKRGLEILDPLMRASGFTILESQAGRSSGGNFASVNYVKQERTLEIHYRHSLGLVTYHMGLDTLRHEVFMRAILGPNRRSRYPGFSDNAIDAFRDLRFDLEHYAADFLTGTGASFRRCVNEARAAQKLSPLDQLEQGWPNSIRETP